MSLAYLNTLEAPSISNSLSVYSVAKEIKLSAFSTSIFKSKYSFTIILFFRSSMPISFSSFLISSSISSNSTSCCSAKNFSSSSFDTSISASASPILTIPVLIELSSPDSFTDVISPDLSSILFSSAISLINNRSLSASCIF